MQPKREATMKESVHSLKIYLKRINEIPLLTRDEEMQLSHKIQEEKCVASLEKLIVSNLRLVVRIAREYNIFTIPLEEFIAQGNVGLIKAAEKYHPNSDCKFSSYAQWWINQQIRIYIGNYSHIVRIPIQAQKKILHIEKFINRYKHENDGKEPSLEKISEATGYAIRSLKTHMLHIKHTEIYLDASANNSDDNTTYNCNNHLHEESVNQPHFLDDITNEDEMKIIYKFLKTFNERDLKVLSMRYGVFGYKFPHKLHQISDVMGITKERVRQIERDVLYKLKMYFKYGKKQN